jgi:peptide deformylase
MRHVLLFTLLACVACCRTAGSFSKEELDLIHNADSIMRVLTIEDPADLLVLRTPSSDLSAEALLSSDYDSLSRLMVATVTHPSQDGVGIAGPQVGINRRIVAVQRFDKGPVWNGMRLDHPFEVYPNIRIIWASDSLAVGPEGCLSVPERRADVFRSTSVIIEYTDLQQLISSRLRQPPHATQSKLLKDNKLNDTVPVIRDTVSGFTAVIFQHEIDHLDGVLYIDRL